LGGPTDLPESDKCGFEQPLTGHVEPDQFVTGPSEEDGFFNAWLNAPVTR